MMDVIFICLAIFVVVFLLKICLALFRIEKSTKHSQIIAEKKILKSYATYVLRLRVVNVYGHFMFYYNR